MRHTVILVALIGTALSMRGQTAPHQQFLPHPLDSLSVHSLDSLQVFLSDRLNGGMPDHKGIPVATYVWDAEGRIQSAVALRLESHTVREKDSVSWTYRADTVFRQGYTLTPQDEDYRYDAPELDFGSSLPLDLPPFSRVFPENTDTLIVSDGRIMEKRDGYSQQVYTYNEAGNLLECKTLNPERIAMGMGGYSWETYTYDHLGHLISKSYIRTGPENRRDTTVHVFQYNSEGQLLTEILPSASVPGVSNMRQYTYEDGQLIRETYNRSTFRSSGPPNYTREPISLRFETTYRYENGQLVEERLARNDELEHDGWLRYTYEEHGLLKQKTRMNVFESTPHLIYTYDYTFRK